MASSEPVSFAGRRVDDADFSGARLRSPNFERTRITDGWLRDADISADITGLTLNGVDVAPLIEAELDRQFPGRVLLRSADPRELGTAWTMIEEHWRHTNERARRLPETLLHERVDDDWSFVETHRHLIMATDDWLHRMIRQSTDAFHPWGLAGSFLDDPASLGLDYSADPSLDAVLEVRREHMDDVASTIAALTPEEMDRLCLPPDSLGYPRRTETVLRCLHVILDEEWMHDRYANRDLTVLERLAAG